MPANAAISADDLRRMQDEIARAAKFLAPQIAAAKEAIEPDLQILRQAVDDVSRTLDPEALQNSRDAAALMAEHYRSLAAHFGQAYAAYALGQAEPRERLTEVLQRRWRTDAGAAETFLRSLLDYKEDIQRRGAVEPRLTGEDIAIAGLYYFRQLTQEQIGEAVGLSQPSIANRLKKIDTAIAHHILVRKIERVAGNENWELAVDGVVGLEDVEVHFDLAAMKPGVEAGVLGIDLNAVTALTLWMPLEERIVGWTEYLASQVPAMHRLQALYDLSENRSYLCSESDLQHAKQGIERAGRAGARLRFGDLREHLPTSLSLDAALERATA